MHPSKKIDSQGVAQDLKLLHPAVNRTAACRMSALIHRKSDDSALHGGESRGNGCTMRGPCCTQGVQMGIDKGILA